MKDEGRSGEMRIRWYSLLAICAVALSACTGTPAATTHPPSLTAALPTPASAATQPPAAPALTPAVGPVTTQPAPVAASRQVAFQTDDGITLSGTLFGQGQVGVALSHMFPTNQTSWHAFAQALADNGYLALAYDFRGYGQSGGQKQIDQIDRDVRAAVEFLRGQGARRIVLIGASMGGTASARVAGPVGADGLVVISSPRSFQGLSVSEDDLRAFQGPSLWIGSRGDAATADTEAMHAQANEPKAIFIYAGSAHGTYIFDTGDAADLTRRLLDFVTGYAPPEQ